MQLQLFNKHGKYLKKTVDIIPDMLCVRISFKKIKTKLSVCNKVYENVRSGQLHKLGSI